MADGKSHLLTPFLKQSFVTAGIAINVAQFGIVAAYVMAIVPQLQQPGSAIPMDDETASWFTSIHGMTVIIGNVMIVQLMTRYGRWVSNVTSAGFMFVGWVFIVVADSVVCLLVGRFLQGISLGLTLALGPVIIGECTSPRYRGFFLSSTTALSSISSTFVHMIALVLHWRTIGLIIVVISFVNLLISIYSTESPSWLASKGRYDECKKVFIKLRGHGEEEELKQLIQASIEDKGKVREKKNAKDYLVDMMKKKEVYKSIVIGIHLFLLCYWCGSAILSSFPIAIINVVVGANYNTPLILVSLDVQRLVTNIAAMYVVKKCKRKTMLLASVGLNVVAFFVIAGYSYAKELNVLPFDHPLIGIMLLHIHIFSVAMGGLPLPIIIIGEIYPLEYRSICSSVTSSVASLNLFLVYKTFLLSVQKFKLSGTYIISGAIVAYSLAVTYYYLPETKDKTLHDIENELRGITARTKDTTEVLLKEVEENSRIECK